MEKQEKLFLLDGMGLVYRAYFALIKNPLINSKGENTSSIYGFTNFLFKILNTQKPDYISVIFDTAEPTFRHKSFKDYKAHRQKMPEDLSAMLPKLNQVIEAFNIPILSKAGFEADDLIATISRDFQQPNLEIFIVTSDKDLMQLINPSTKIYKPGKFNENDEIIDEKGVELKFGIPPHHITDYLALVGDASDNVPGVQGVGPKTALPLIQKFGTLENIYKNLEKIDKKSLSEKLKDNKEIAFISKDLVTTHFNVPLNIILDDLKIKEKNTPKLLSLFKDLEMKTFYTRLSSEKSISKTTEIEPIIIPETDLSNIHNTKHEYLFITKKDELKKLLTELKNSHRFVFDTETTSANPHNAQLVGISFSTKSSKAFYIPLHQDFEELKFGFEFEDKKENKKSKYLDLEFVLNELKPIFEDHTILKIGQNIKYDSIVLANYGIEIKGIEFDTMVASYVARSDSQHNLDSLAKEYLGYQTITFEELTEEKKNIDLRTIPLEKIGNYSAEDADITFKLYEVLHNKISAQDMLDLCNKVEFPLIKVLISMELKGITIDKKFLNKMSDKLEDELSKIKKEIYKTAGEEFNINSTQQLAAILFDVLKLSPVKKTKSGYSTDVSVLERLKNAHPIITQLLDYRQITKLKSTYIDALPELINPRTGKVHTSFNQTIASTGRLISSEPNLQNIPIRTELGREIRKAIIPSNDRMKIVSADYSQIELRIMAHISEDSGLIEAFMAKEDIHTTTAAKIFNVKNIDVTKDMRRKAKEVNFGIMYGIGAFGLSNRLEITHHEAKEIISTYNKRFPKVRQYIFDTISFAKQHGYVTTLLKRRRYFPDIRSANAFIRQNAERQAINMPIQGTAADMIKIAMINIFNSFKKQKVKSNMLLQVHDELVFEVEINELEKVKNIISDEMINALPLKVPIEVEVGVGDNWFEAH
ncbi:MAG: DNA polymerase I [Bacteroidetes bacterium]|nr:DNA polymerase I [Bacteroidota bacterium]